MSVTLAAAWCDSWSGGEAAAVESSHCRTPRAKRRTAVHVLHHRCCSAVSTRPTVRQCVRTVLESSDRDVVTDGSRQGLVGGKKQRPLYQLPKAAALTRTVTSSALTEAWLSATTAWYSLTRSTRAASGCEGSMDCRATHLNCTNSFSLCIPITHPYAAWRPRVLLGHLLIGSRRHVTMVIYRLPKQRSLMERASMRRGWHQAGARGFLWQQQ